MPSILPGYEYDIFISYRQKDNRSDQWVTNFVKALREELDATFKQEISIYFDSNPHDGLLETHDVDGSLKEKIKCLVFIPIVSQTYCDPNSFAWQKEFLAFVDFAKADQYGLDIKLANGNVAKRVLPVRIHEIDEADRKLYESTIGGVMRPVDFVYKEPGVNRPLVSNEENPSANLNKTFYKNQVNKVSNAVKEIITAMKGEHPGSHPTASAAIAPLKKIQKKKLVIGVVLLIAFAAWLFYQFKNSAMNIGASEASIAILPFLNNTGKAEMDYYGLGVASEIRTQLAVAKQFDFISSMQSTIAFKNSVEEPKSIGEKLGVTHIITGMYQGVENNLQGVVELVEASSGKIVWSLPFNTQAADFYKLQASIANDVISQFKGEEVKQNAGTTNLEAFAELSRGEEILYRSAYAPDQLPAAIHFKKAIQLDSGFIEAWGSLISLYSHHYWLRPDDTTIQRPQIENLIAYVNSAFEDSWQKKEMMGIYTYNVLREFEKAKELFLEVVHENPDAERANDLLSAIHKRQLNAQLAFKYRLKGLKQRRTANDWLELGFIVRNTGDYNNAALAFGNVGDPTLIWGYQLAYNENKLGELPQKTKVAMGLRIQCDEILLKRDYSGLLRRLRQIKPDSTILQSHIQILALYAHYGLRQDDSVKILASQFNQPSLDPFRNSIQNGYGMRPEFLKSSILAGKSKLGELIDPADKQFKQDLMMQCYYEIVEIQVAILIKDFKGATERLLALNKNYPAFGDFSWLNRPEFDRIKEEYPPFQEAINNLKLPPKTLDLGGLKW